MKGWNSNRWSFWNKVLAGCCVVTAAALIAFLLWYRSGEQKRTQEIVRAAQEAEDTLTDNSIQQTGENIQPTETVEEETGQQIAGDSGISKEAAPESAGTAGETVTQDGVKETLIGISWRGDEFLSGDEIRTLSAPALLEKRLQEENYEISVENFSLTGAGTLSQMRLAGVSEEKIGEYVEAHTQLSDGESSQMETGVREFSTEELNRSDQTYFPVIFMGYYGGWNNDPEELSDQIQLILNTYDSPEEFLVLGLHPVSGGINPEGYQQIMEETWGEYYIDLPEVLDGVTAASYDGQKRIADAVFEKLTELGYLV